MSPTPLLGVAPGLHFRSFVRQACWPHGAQRLSVEGPWEVHQKQTGQSKRSCRHGLHPHFALHENTHTCQKCLSMPNGFQ